MALILIFLLLGTNGVYFRFLCMKITLLFELIAPFLSSVFHQPYDSRRLFFFCSDVQATLYTPTVPKHTYTDPLARTRLPSVALATQAHTRRNQTGPHNTKPRLPHSDRGTDLTRRVTGKQEGNGQVSVPRLPSVLSSFTGESSRRLFSYFLSL